jgi:hypothetical protein
MEVTATAAETPNHPARKVFVGFQRWTPTMKCWCSYSWRRITQPLSSGGSNIFLRASYAFDIPCWPCLDVAVQVQVRGRTSTDIVKMVPC